MNPKRHALRHIVIQMVKFNEKERICCFKESRKTYFTAEMIKCDRRFLPGVIAGWRPAHPSKVLLGSVFGHTEETEMDNNNGPKMGEMAHHIQGNLRSY